MGHPWYSFYPKDYRDKTSGLTMVQDCAYRRLMDEYYITSKPLPANADVLLRICRAFADDEKAAVPFVLEQYFTLEADGWHHQRIDEELQHRADLSEKRAKAGSKGAAKTNSAPPAIAETKNRQLPTHTHTHSQSQEEVSSLRSDTSAAASPPAPALGPVFIAFPTNRFEKHGEEFAIYEPFVEEMQGLFPAIDVRDQLRAMRAWLLTHDRQRKTKSGMKRFINGWLARSQDRGPSRETIQGNGNGRGRQGPSAHDKFVAAAASLVGDYIGSAEGGNDSGPANETGRPLLSA